MSEYTPTRERLIAAYISDKKKALGSKLSVDDCVAEFERFIADVKADAWDEGLQAGWEECQDPDPFVNDWWDSKAPNPHRIEREA